MSLVQAVTNSFKLELLQGIHAIGTDTLKLALYTNAATLDENTTAYSATNEVSGTGYVAGGATAVMTAGSLMLYDVVTPPGGRIAGARLDPITWEAPASFTCRGGLLYNASKSNKSIMVLDFGGDLGPSAGASFIVYFKNTLPPIIRAV